MMRLWLRLRRWLRFVRIARGSVIGERVEFDPYSCTSGAVIVGDDCKIKMRAIVGQGSIMEPKCWIGPMAITLHEKYARWHTDAPEVSYGCYLHSGCVLGAGVIVIAGVTIGYNAEIGAGSVVTHDCEENGIYIGSPARRVGTVPPERRVDVVRGEPLRFTPEVLERYLPNLERVGRYACRCKREPWWQQVAEEKGWLIR